MKVGTTDIIDLKSGDTQINKVYSGTDLVWDKTPPTPSVNDTFVLFTTFNSSNSTWTTYKWNYTINQIIWSLPIGNTTDSHSVYFGPNPNGSSGEVQYDIINRNSISNVRNPGFSIYTDNGTPNTETLIANINIPFTAGNFNNGFPHMSNFYRNRYFVYNENNSPNNGGSVAYDFQTSSISGVSTTFNGRLSALSKSGSLFWIVMSSLATTIQTRLYPNSTTGSTVLSGLEAGVSRKVVNTGNLKDNFVHALGSSGLYEIVFQSIVNLNVSFTLSSVSVGAPIISSILCDDTATTTNIYISHERLSTNFLSKYVFNLTTNTFTLLWRTNKTDIITTNSQISRVGVFNRNNIKTVGVFCIVSGEVKLLHFNETDGSYIKTENLPFNATSVNRILVYDKNNW
jgi:hypothetical protein